MSVEKNDLRIRRKKRIRKKVTGTSERPRLTVYRSLRHMSAQVVDDQNNRVIVAVSTQGKANQANYEGLSKTDQAKKIGQALAEQCKAKGVGKVVFDRNGFQYHGRILAVADSAREGGLEF